ncbi:MAG: hypothetical protein B7X99_05720 [Rhizobiales bacterium 17-65-6]|nr:MAG: hypothetical protein B7Z30_15555 [Rhizobiales bacterium 12-68-15]OYX86452.1 MAG: hypothetical protein B7Y84_14080 [Azorhizobium sp. 32-67-21]OZA00023.1 MAG: hypothetical protein B7X99_05720 [Rhizobiales bacterium 17-65-6]
MAPRDAGLGGVEIRFAVNLQCELRHLPGDRIQFDSKMQKFCKIRLLRVGPHLRPSAELQTESKAVKVGVG